MTLTSRDNIIPATTSLRDALDILERSEMKILILVDENEKLIGTCTDGDFRRAILRTGNLEGDVLQIANTSPRSLTMSDGRDAALALMKKHDIRQLPILDENGRIADIIDLSHKDDTPELTTPVIIMAGGLGSRLAPLTDNCPKPMLPLGDRPILEHIIQRFVDQGFREFHIAVNYLGHLVEEHFGDGRHFGIRVNYLREKQRLGTAGALTLLPDTISSPFIVINADLITDMDFTHLLKIHNESDSMATMCIREHMSTIPFGVVQFDGEYYLRTDEKPTLTHHINAGIYCLSADALKHVPDDTFYDMPTLFTDLTKQKKRCSVHVVHNSWIDIGTPDQYQSAQQRFRAKTI